MSHEPVYFNLGVDMIDGNLEDLLLHENNVTTLESKPEHSVKIKVSQNVLDTNELVCASKSDEESSLDINSSSDLTLFVSSSNVSESGIALLSDELNNVNNENSDSNMIGKEESNDLAIIHPFENSSAETIDDDGDCYVVGSFKSTASVKNGNTKLDQSGQIISVVECVDLTQDEPGETKLCDSLAREFTKDTRLCILLDVIPDADPDFLMKKINEFNTDDDLQLFVLNALETQNYPKIGAIEKILPNQTAQRAEDITYVVNEDVSGYDDAHPLDYSTSKHSALADDNITTHFAGLNSTIPSSLDREGNREDPSIRKTYTTVSDYSHAVSSIVSSIAALRKEAEKLFRPDHPLAVVSKQYHFLQRQAQPKITVGTAKPHTVTSQEASYDHTSSNILQTVTSHTDVRYPGFSIQDLPVSQQVGEKSGTPLSTHVPTVESHAETRYADFSIQDLRVSQQGSEKSRTPLSTHIPIVTSHADVRYQGFSVQDLRVSQQGSEKPGTSLSTPIPTVTSHADVRYPGFSFQDLRVSQQGSEKSGTSLSTHIPTVTSHADVRYPEISFQDLRVSQQGSKKPGTSLSTHIPTVTSHTEVRYPGFLIEDLRVSQQGSEKPGTSISTHIPTVTSHADVRYPEISFQDLRVSQQGSKKTGTSLSTPIPTVTSHTEVRYPGFLIEDLRVSQPGSEKSGTPLSMHFPTPSPVPFTQTGNNNRVNTQVNVPAYPVSFLQNLLPKTTTPHAKIMNAAFPRRPENARVWYPMNNLINPITLNIQNAMREQRKHFFQTIRRHRRHHHFNVDPHHLDFNVMETSLSNFTKVKDGSPSFNLLADILIWADPEFLRSEAKKLKNDDDVEKFLLRAIANEKLWNKCVAAENSTPRVSPESVSDNKYKILLELLPDANPTFLKRECAKLKDDEEVHEFAMKLGREQTYPKRKSSNISHNNKGIKRKHGEISEPTEIIDPKYQTLLDMLPDADPDFLLRESKVLQTPDDLQKFVLKAVEDKTYPKRDQYLERQEYHKQWKKYIEDFNIKEYLQVIPNPVKFFYIDKVNSKTPLNMPGDFLQHRYRRKSNHHFDYYFSTAKHNLTKTCDILDVHYPTKPRKYSAWDQKTMFSTSILQEIAFIQNKKEIAHYLLFKEEMKLEAYEKGKTEGTLQECSCCCEDKLSEDMTSCLAGHMYCLNCIKRGSEVVIGNGGTKFPCYSEDCKEEFSIDILKTVLNPEVFSRLLIRKQYEEVNAAGIPGLETCSFCEFCSIPPAEDKLFRCLNPSCMKVTCRSCKKLDHLPLSCEEFAEKETTKKMQSYVEDKMTEALVRTCWQCGTKFIKENGCNMMQCKCGAKMCYFCRQPVKDYHHFNEGRCGKFLDTTAHDEAAVIKVGKKAKQEIEAANPGYSLPNDPTKLLFKEPKQPKYYDYF